MKNKVTILCIGLLCMSSTFVFGMNRECDDYEKLKIAIEKNDIQVVKGILDKKKLQLNDTHIKYLQDDFKLAPLHFACMYGCSEITKLLIESGASVDIKDTYGSSVIAHACVGGNIATIELLVEYGADLQDKNRFKENLLHRASACGHPKVVEYLLEKGLKIDETGGAGISGYTPLHFAAEGGNFEVVKILVERGANLEIGHYVGAEKGLRPLHLACLEGHTKIVEYLLKAKANVNSKCSNGQTPLHKAIMFRENKYRNGYHYEIAKLLLKSGANVNEPNIWGQTPLHYASYRCRDNLAVDLFELLLGKDADISARDKWGDKPLDLVSKKGCLEIVKLLVEKGYKKRELTDLHKAVAWLDLEKVKEIILSKKIDINSQNESGRTPLHFAAYRSCGFGLVFAEPREKAKTVIRLLLKNGADHTIKNDCGQTPLEEAYQVRDYCLNNDGNTIGKLSVDLNEALLEETNSIIKILERTHARRERRKMLEELEKKHKSEMKKIDERYDARMNELYKDVGEFKSYSAAIFGAFSLKNKKHQKIIKEDQKSVSKIQEKPEKATIELRPEIERLQIEREGERERREIRQKAKAEREIIEVETILDIEKMRAEAKRKRAEIKKRAEVKRRKMRENLLKK